MQPKTTSHILKGVIIAIVFMALDFMAQKDGDHLPVWLRYLPLFVLMGGAAVSGLIFARQSADKPAFGDVFAHGFKTTAVFTVLIAVYTLISIKYVFPPTEKDIQAAMSSIQQQGNVMPQEVRKMAVDASKNAWVISVSGEIFACVILGLVGSLIGGVWSYATGAATTKKKS